MSGYNEKKVITDLLFQVSQKHSLTQYQIHQQPAACKESSHPHFFNLTLSIIKD